MSNSNNKLPAEILVNIMSYIPSTDKANCSEACKTWYQHISQTAWFDTLSLHNNDRLIEAQELFIEEPHLGQQIRHLTLLKDAKHHYQYSKTLTKYQESRILW